MKEAAGEANMTVVTIILIAAIVAVATPIVTSTLGKTAQQGCCTSAGGTWHNGACDTSLPGYSQDDFDACMNSSGQGN